jgi:hypothetical protein
MVVGITQCYPDNVFIDDVPPPARSFMIVCLKYLNHLRSSTCWVSLYTSYIEFLGLLSDWFI